MLCDTTGMVYNFEIYAEKILPAVDFPDLGASVNIVFRLVSVLKPDVNHIVCFDNWFTSFPLVVELAKLSIFTLGTIRSNELMDVAFQLILTCAKEEEEHLKKRVLL